MSANKVIQQVKIVSILTGNTNEYVVMVTKFFFFGLVKINFFVRHNFTLTKNIDEAKKFYRASFPIQDSASDFMEEYRYFVERKITVMDARVINIFSDDLRNKV